MFSDGVGGQLTETVAGLLNPGGRLLAYGSAAAFYTDRADAIGSDRTLRVLRPISNVVDGFANLPRAVVQLYESSHAGKLQVRF
jgi:NADPH-dependent curcumin reductase CurA